MAVDVDLAAPVIVAVHVNGNAPVEVIGPERPWRRSQDRKAATEIGHGHGWGHVQVHVNDHGGGHVDVNVNVIGHGV